MKLGRNDLCDCGSGLKYKHCHYDSDREAGAEGPAVIGDLVAVRMGDRIRAIHDFNGRVEAPTADLRARLLRRIGRRLEGRDAAEALIAFMDDLEVETSRIAARHSPYYWLHLARRVPPTAIAGSSDWTVTLYRRILTLAILKHGSRGREEELVLTHEEGLGSTLNVEELTSQDVIDKDD